MPLRLEIKRKLAQRSERVKSLDLHPTEPWLLASLYSGTVGIWNYQSQVEERSGEEEVQEEAQDEGQEEAVVVDADSTDGAVFVNGNEADEEWGTNNEGNPSA
ncbi:coatomer subunit beta'-2-like [Actinidia eriantha]|uniref:coatomer subunit beta'-2-like n=1 Tax=Actinidia eriantha TaxID=165200 RepID=UPI00258A1CDE|nr:coatomer subunit beta'-2-like [Actinidia eriantha]XP_057464275.1 coatomer subunit beta'-2-like [Actinidia eriantha]XP_057464276.1 coatomer subunit beta'-2-like [Actinidia eriantha]